MKRELGRYLVTVSVAVVAILALLLSACQLVGGTQSQTPVKIRIGSSSGAGSLAIVVADVEGMYKKRNLETTIKMMPSSVDTVNAMLAGDVDSSLPSATIVNNTIGRGGDIVILGVATRFEATEKVIGRPDIKGPADLKGKKIAAAKGSSSEYMMSLYLKKGGLTAKDVEWVYADPPEIVALMDRGEVVAFSLWEPFPTRSLELSASKVKILAAGMELGHDSGLHLLTMRKFDQENQEALTRYLAALHEANQFIAKNHDRAAQILADKIKVDTAQASKLIKETTYGLVADKQMTDYLRSVGEWFKATGRLDEVPDYQKHIDTKPMKAVDPAAVKL
ncbi:MAG: ABC transporter substrate-binding protein [Chloroflexi bacterium]|nr:ABC transporter substrate-binding protein [Chloroflexota bacterium]